MMVLILVIPLDPLITVSADDIYWEHGGDGESFTPISLQNSRLSLFGQIRDMIPFNYKNNAEVVIFASNDGPIQVY